MASRCYSAGLRLENRLYNIELFLFNNSRQETETSTTPCNEPTYVQTKTRLMHPSYPTCRNILSAKNPWNYILRMSLEKEEYHTLPANIPLSRPPLHGFIHISLSQGYRTTHATPQYRTSNRGKPVQQDRNPGIDYRRRILCKICY